MLSILQLFFCHSSTSIEGLRIVRGQSFIFYICMLNILRFIILLDCTVLPECNAKHNLGKLANECNAGGRTRIFKTTITKTLHWI